MTEKENALRVFRREKPEWLPRFEKCMKGYFPKSINERPLNWEGDDWFGIHWVPDASTNGLTAPRAGPGGDPGPGALGGTAALPDLEAIDWAAEAEGFRRPRARTAVHDYDGDGGFSSATNSCWALRTPCAPFTNTPTRPGRFWRR